MDCLYEKSSKVYLFRKFCWPSLLLVFYSRGNQNQIDGSTEIAPAGDQLRNQAARGWRQPPVESGAKSLNQCQMPVRTITQERMQSAINQDQVQAGCTDSQIAFRARSIPKTTAGNRLQHGGEFAPSIKLKCQHVKLVYLCPIKASEAKLLRQTSP